MPGCRSAAWAGTVDVTDREALERCATAAVAEFGHIDLVCCAAGVIHTGTVLASAWDDVARVVGINLLGTMGTVEAFLPYLIASPGGHVVLCSSGFGLFASARYAAYSASKFGVRGFGEALRMEMALGGHPVRVTCAYPGAVRTPIMRSGTFAGGEDAATVADRFDRLARTDAGHAAEVILRRTRRGKARAAVGADARAAALAVRVLDTGYLRLVPLAVRLARRRAGGWRGVLLAQGRDRDERGGRVLVQQHGLVPCVVSGGCCPCAAWRQGTSMRRQRPAASYEDNSRHGSHPPAAVSEWPLWELPHWHQVLVAGVVGVYCAATCAAVALTRVQAGQLRLFAVLLACSAASVELTRRASEPGAVASDVYAIWDLPAAVLLPPAYALLAALPRMALTQLRVSRTTLHHRAYTAAAGGLAYAAASLAFHAAVPVLGPGAGAETGGAPCSGRCWPPAAACSGSSSTTDWSWPRSRDASSRTRLLPGIARAEVLYGKVAELSLGTLSAFAAVHAMLAIVYALPLVVSLQRSLRHAQLVAETRVDSKTGLLNDKTWRRQAAAEVARAARSRTPVAIGIIDIDHFKKVNDAYGHPAGDAVLAAVAAAVTVLLRDYDVIGRVGGEEFGFVLPNSPLLEAVEVAERLREKIPQIARHRDGSGQATPRVTVSIGIATVARPGGDLGSYYSLADQALYAAKQNGRDAVWVVQADQAADPKPRPSGAVRAPCRRMTSAEWVWRAELNDLLRACRARLARPAVPGTRRGGMRQEDVASLAGISLRRYAAFERGEFTPPAAMVDQVAAALQMTQAERSALHVLATGQDPPRPLSRPAQDSPCEPSRALRDLVTYSRYPAALTDAMWTLLHFNPALDAWADGWFGAAEPGRPPPRVLPLLRGRRTLPA